MPEDNIKSAICFVGTVWASRQMFEGQEGMKSFEAMVSALGQTISREHNLQEHLSIHRTLPIYMKLKPISQEHFNSLKAWVREEGWSK